MSNGYMPPAKTVEWATPQGLYDKLNAEFGFTVDVCATPENAKCARYYTADIDGLKQDWTSDICWCNPPYGAEIKAWIRKSYFTQEGGGRSNRVGCDPCTAYRSWPIRMPLQSPETYAKVCRKMEDMGDKRAELCKGSE